MSAATNRKADQAYAAAVSWAASVPVDELRRGNAERVARSYGITAAQADTIIVQAFRKRSK